MTRTRNLRLDENVQNLALHLVTQCLVVCRVEGIWIEEMNPVNSFTRVQDVHWMSNLKNVTVTTKLRKPSRINFNQISNGCKSYV